MADYNCRKLLGYTLLLPLCPELSWTFNLFLFQAKVHLDPNVRYISLQKLTEVHILTRSFSYSSSFAYIMESILPVTVGIFRFYLTMYCEMFEKKFSLKWNFFNICLLGVIIATPPGWPYWQHGNQVRKKKKKRKIKLWNLKSWFFGGRKIGEPKGKKDLKANKINTTCNPHIWDDT